MAIKTRNIVLGSIGVAGLLAAASVLDIATAFPFAGQVAFDVMFLLAAALTIYMGIDCLKDAK